MRVHFGLGDVERIDGLRVRWPSGAVDEIGSVDTDRYVTVREGSNAVAP
jgi:hypothetical protein